MKSMPSVLSSTDQLQSLVAFLIREPVEEAVRTVLREESITVDSDRPSTSDDSTEHSEEESGGAASKVVVGALVLAIVGVVYKLRKRTTDSSEDAPGVENRITGPNSDTDSEIRSPATTE